MLRRWFDGTQENERIGGISISLKKWQERFNQWLLLNFRNFKIDSKSSKKMDSKSLTGSFRNKSNETKNE